jgi:pyruvate-formate lyase
LQKACKKSASLFSPPSPASVAGGGSVVGATPDGRLAGEQLADGGLSPMVGQDAQGPTAVTQGVGIDHVKLNMLQLELAESL